MAPRYGFLGFIALPLFVLAANCVDGVEIAEAETAEAASALCSDNGIADWAGEPEEYGVPESLMSVVWESTASRPFLGTRVPLEVTAKVSVSNYLFE
ncbi:hypothetical protein [Polyangium sp. y55x31]|uniref:hypothetical protein n=1 Tax=Polyangium sp. y55x31 TaxID=3042688 RepID=UPI00248262C8|nr:hypothetical protein [Polyangium sp. y55x31]MDI1477596.1 hypothetical protein [Polyangium sp. y55x31]